MWIIPELVNYSGVIFIILYFIIITIIMIMIIIIIIIIIYLFIYFILEYRSTEYEKENNREGQQNTQSLATPDSTEVKSQLRNA